MARPALSADVMADIYEAAVDDERWPLIANIVTAAAGVNSGAVWIVEQSRVVDFSITEDGIASQAPYLAHYSKLDFWNQALMRGPWERARIGYELYSEREMLKTEFYNDFLRPHGVFRPVAAVVRFDHETFATVSINGVIGSKKLLEEVNKTALDCLLPHVKRALQLRLRQRRYAAGRSLHAAILDTLAFGVVVCDAAGRPVLVNKAAEAMARDGAGIMLGGTKKGLGAIMPAEHRTLVALVRGAASGGAGGIMRVSGRSGYPELIALVTPLPRHLARDASLGSSYALVTLRSAWDSSSFSAEMLMELFSLSRTQAAIALSIFDGKSPEQIAAQRGVTISTLRTHLAEIFARTGAENQRDLVRLLGMLPPIRTRPDRG